jgi:phosphohistidine swiveling domain-containing protein
LKKEILSNKRSFNILKQIKFPDCILSSRDIYFQKIKSSKGNFITNKKVNGNIVYLKSLNSISELKNKIVLLENADPGFDFIFSHEIKGLITKYGGSNSHMTIRCLELSVPAIIGIGFNEFDQIKGNNSIEFDCEQKTFKSIN